MINQLIISAPWGNYISRPGVTSTLGTFTAYSRRTAQTVGGVYTPKNEKFWWAGAAWRFARHCRYKADLGGHVNNQGLRNPGIGSIANRSVNDCLVSIHGFNMAEWQTLIAAAYAGWPACIEFNFSCPNVLHPGDMQTILEQAGAVLQLAHELCPHAYSANCGPVFSVKIPPVNCNSWIDYILTRFPATIINCCNTVPCAQGGLSGKHVQIAALQAIRYVRQHYPHCELIGGGGVTSTRDLDHFKIAGANHVSVGSYLLSPWHWPAILTFRDYLNANYPVTAVP